MQMYRSIERSCVECRGGGGRPCGDANPTKRWPHYPADAAAPGSALPGRKARPHAYPAGATVWSQRRCREPIPTNGRVMPIGFGHPPAIGSDPGRILDRRAANIASLKKLAAAQDGVANVARTVTLSAGEIGVRMADRVN